MITVTTSGDFGKTYKFLNNMKHMKFLKTLSKCAQMGIDALREYTPKDSGVTADSWYSEIEETDNSVTICWKNSNINDYYPIAIGIQYGHGTGTGGYVQGVDYINPALRPVFEEIERLVREEAKA